MRRALGLLLVVPAFALSGAPASAASSAAPCTRHRTVDTSGSARLYRAGGDLVGCVDGLRGTVDVAEVLGTDVLWARVQGDWASVIVGFGDHCGSGEVDVVNLRTGERRFGPYGEFRATDALGCEVRPALVAVQVRADGTVAFVEVGADGARAAIVGAATVDLGDDADPTTVRWDGDHLVWTRAWTEERSGAFARRPVSHGTLTFSRPSQDVSTTATAPSITVVRRDGSVAVRQRLRAAQTTVRLPVGLYEARVALPRGGPCSLSVVFERDDVTRSYVVGRQRVLAVVGGHRRSWRCGPR